MKVPLVWLVDAVTDYDEALAWYAAISPTLARRFADAVDLTMQNMSNSPLHFAEVHGTRRRAGLERFP